MIDLVATDEAVVTRCGGEDDAEASRRIELSDDRVCIVVHVEGGLDASASPGVIEVRHDDNPRTHFVGDGLRICRISHLPSFGWRPLRDAGIRLQTLGGGARRRGTADGDAGSEHDHGPCMDEARCAHGLRLREVLYTNRHTNQTFASSLPYKEYDRAPCRVRSVT